MEGDKQTSPVASSSDKNGSGGAGGVIFLLKATFDDPVAERPRPTRFNMKSTRTVGEVATWVRKNIGPTMWNKWDVVLMGIIDYDQWDDRNATIEPVAAQLPIGRVWTPGSCLVFAPEPPMLIGLQPRSLTSSSNYIHNNNNVLTDKSKADENTNPLMRLFAPTSCLSLAFPTLPGLED